MASVIFSPTTWPMLLMIKRASQTPTTAGFPSILHLPVTMASLRRLFPWQPGPFSRIPESSGGWKRAFPCSTPQRFPHPPASRYGGMHEHGNSRCTWDIRSNCSLHLPHRLAARTCYICAIILPGLPAPGRNRPGAYISYLFSYTFFEHVPQHCNFLSALSTCIERLAPVLQAFTRERTSQYSARSFRA